MENTLYIIDGVAERMSEANKIEDAQLQVELGKELEELERTKQMLSAQTALAWMGMTSTHWRHVIEGHAITIVHEVSALRRALRRGSKSERIEKKLAKIEKLAKMIQDKPITPPQDSEEGVRSVPINAFFRERLQQLQQIKRYRLVECQVKSRMEEGVTVWISPQWLRRAFDILIDNAVEAVSQASVKRITITTELDNGWVKVSVADTGRGIPLQVRPILFQKPISKSKGGKGLGMGLLMAQTIVQTYGGEIKLASTSPSGTTMIMRLPADQTPRS